MRTILILLSLLTLFVFGAMNTSISNTELTKQTQLNTERDKYLAELANEYAKYQADIDLRIAIEHQTTLRIIAIAVTIIAILWLITRYISMPINTPKRLPRWKVIGSHIDNNIHKQLLDTYGDNYVKVISNQDKYRYDIKYRIVDNVPQLAISNDTDTKLIPKI